MKDKAPRIENGLLGLELDACGGDVRTILLGGAQSSIEGNLVTIVESSDRAYSYFDFLIGAQPRSDLVERQIRLLGNELEQPVLVLLEWRADVTSARLRLDAAGLRPALDPADRGRGADIEQPCRLPCA
jgi:hypothetical protein